MSDAKDEAQKWLASLDIRLGLYRHYKGGEYIVFAVTLTEDTLSPRVHYYSVEKGTRWTRTEADFFGQVAGDQPRFTYVGPVSDSDMLKAVLLLAPGKKAE